MAAWVLSLAIALVAASNPCHGLRRETVLRARYPGLAVQQYCQSFQYNAEVNNYEGWLVPEECVDQIGNYTLGGQHQTDILGTVIEAKMHAKSVYRKHDGLDAWVLDVDDTALSNTPYYAARRFGASKHNDTDFKLWVEQGNARAIDPIRSMFEELVSSNWSVIFISERSEEQRQVTVNNLLSAGYKGWKELILASPEGAEKLRAERTQSYKEDARKEVKAKGYRVQGNVGDQWSDISGGDSEGSSRSFKLANPIYHVA